MLRFIESKNIDLEKWNNLLANVDQVFCYKAYFESLAENWGALVLNDYEAALVVPYKKKLFWTWVYTPQFYRASYWMGAWSEHKQQAALALLKSQFSFGSLNLGYTTGLENTFFHQEIEPSAYDEDNYNNLARRMIRKAESVSIQITKEWDETHFLTFLQAELGPKIDDFQGPSMHVFRDLLRSLQNAGIFHFEGAVVGGALVGGLISVQLPGRHLYLKGTANLEAKKSGAYYLLMHRAIKRAVAADAVFDFGGSRVEGVAQFNRNFGARDNEYNNYSWGSEPTPFKILKIILNRLKK